MPTASPDHPPDEPEDHAPRPTEFILKRARAGNEDAWRELYERYRRMLIVAVELRIPGSLRRRFDGEDVLQNAFSKVFHHIESFEYQGEGSFRVWLKQIVMREFANLVKEQDRAKRRPSNEVGGVEALEQREDEVGPPSQVMRELEEKQSLMAGMARLPEEHREILSMRFFEELSYAEIGAILGCSRDAAKRRVDRAVALLTREME